MTSSAEEDHAQVLAMLQSEEMQKRLEEARAKREKVLAERKAKGPEPGRGPSYAAGGRPTGGRPTGGGLAEAPAPPPFLFPGAGAPAPRPAEKSAAIGTEALPVQPAARRSRGPGLVVGLICGSVLGAALTWLVAPAPPAPSEVVAGAEVPAAPDASAPAPSGEGAGTAAPPVALTTPPADLRLDPSEDEPAPDFGLADRTPARPAAAPPGVPQAADAAPNAPPGAPAPAGVSRSPPSLAEPSPPDEAAARLAAIGAPTAPPARSAAAPRQRRTPRTGPRRWSRAHRPSAVPRMQVALHLPPGLPEAAAGRGAGDAERVEPRSGEHERRGLRRGGERGAALLSPRGRHRGGAGSAAPWRQRWEPQRATLRRFSAYRPAPPAGTLEVWLAAEEG